VSLPRNPNLFIQPLDPADFIPSEQNTNPGLTQLAADTLDNLGTEADGFDGQFNDAVATVDAWDAALGELDTALDSVLALLNSTDPASFSQSMLGYASTFDVGRSIVAAGAGLKTPELLELPINPGYGTAPVAPPAEVGIDLGTVTLGAPAFDYPIGHSEPTLHGVTGVNGVQLVSGDPAIFAVLATNEPREFHDRTGNRWVNFAHTYTLRITPAAAGQWMAQINAWNFQSPGFVIVTFSLTVIP
jgi:hypothetical protein